MSIRDIEQQIDLTRHALDETLHALQARLSPTRRFRSAWGATQAGGKDAIRTGVAWAASHPISVLAIGAAVVLAVLSRSDIRRG